MRNCRSTAVIVTLWVVVLMLAGCLVCFGQQPKAIVTGPKESAIGDLVILDASQSQGLGYLWILVNSDKTYLPVDGGLRLVFSSGTPGKFLFVLVVSGVNNNGGPAADMAKWEVAVSGGLPVPPKPVPPDPPDPPQPGRRTVTILRESSQPGTPQQIEMYGRLATDEAIQGKHQVTILDPDQPHPKELDGVELPGCLVVGDADQVLYVGPAPKDWQAMLELLKRTGG